MFRAIHSTHWSREAIAYTRLRCGEIMCKYLSHLRMSPLFYLLPLAFVSIGILAIEASSSFHQFMRKKISSQSQASILCQNYQAGRCVLGERCRYQHTTAEHPKDQPKKVFLREILVLLPYPRSLRMRMHVCGSF